MDGYANYVLPRGSYDINEFRGYNATYSAVGSEMREMMNLSSRNFPVLSPRKPRSEFELPEGIGNIEKMFCAGGKLCFIADGKIWYDEKCVGYVTPGTEKSVAVCNGRICIAPDMVYYDYLKDKFGRMDGKVSIYTSPTYRCIYRLNSSFRACTYTTEINSFDFPWGKYMNVGDGIRLYNFRTGTVSERYIVKSITEDSLILSKEDGSELDEYNNTMRTAFVINDRDVLVFEAVNCTNGSDEDGNYTAEFSFVDGVGTAQMSSMDKFREIFLDFEKDDVIKFNGEDKEYTVGDVSFGKKTAKYVFSEKPPDIGGAVTIERTVPAGNFICEKDNRLYCVCSDDNTVNVSKLGQPCNFRYFPGTSVDAYSVEVGSDGDFTGISVFDGDVILFKERYIHILSGTKPSLYRLSGIEAFGVQAGCSGSICSVCGRLFYKSSGGIYVFSGSYPKCISRNLGDVKYTGAFSADDDVRYYVSMADSTNERKLFVYDTEYGLWHIEDCGGAVSMCEFSGDIYMAYSDRAVVFSSGDELVPWSGVFGPFDMYTENKKVIYSVSLRYILPQRSSFGIEVSYDGGEYEVVKEIFYSTGTSLSLEIPVRRCDEFCIRLSGKGDICIKSLSFKYREGAYGK